MKFLLTLYALLISYSLSAELHYSKSGDVLDPGMYWAIHAREKIKEIKNGKGNKERMMQNLQLSASYGFKPAMLSISAIYQNGDYGFQQDLPKAYAWWILSMGDYVNDYKKNIEAFKSVMSNEQNNRAEELLLEYSDLYSQAAILDKFEKWYAEATAVTGSRLGGDHSYLNLQIQANGRTISATEFYKKLNEIHKAKLNDLYRVIPQEIQTKEEKD